MSEQPRQQHDMWADPEADPRTAIPDGRGEKAVLAGYLDRYRMTLELKCQDLGPEELAHRSVPPSALSLLGLVRHLARVEQHWFRRILQGQDLPRLFDDEDAGFSFGPPTPELVAASWELWHGEVDHARESTPRSTSTRRSRSTESSTKRATWWCTWWRSTPGTSARRPAARGHRRSHRPVTGRAQ